MTKVKYENCPGFIVTTIAAFRLESENPEPSVKLAGMWVVIQNQDLQNIKGEC